MKIWNTHVYTCVHNHVYTLLFVINCFLLFRLALFEWFVDIRVTLKGRLSRKTFLAKAKALHEEYLKKKAHAGEDIPDEEKNMVFSDQWLKG